MLIILINASIDSNHAAKLKVLFVVAFTKKKNKENAKSARKPST